MSWYLKNRFVQTHRCHLRSAAYVSIPTNHFLHCSSRVPLAALLDWFDISPSAIPNTSAPGGLLACKALTHDEVKRVPCISSGIHFPSPAGDSLIAFQTAIMSSLLYGFFLKMITISYYFSNKNSTFLPLCNVCPVDFNSTSCLNPACISVFLYIPSFAIVILSNLYLEIFLSIPFCLEGLWASVDTIKMETLRTGFDVALLISWREK